MGNGEMCLLYQEKIESLATHDGRKKNATPFSGMAHGTSMRDGAIFG